MKTSTLTLALALALATVLQAQVSIEQAQVSIEEVANEVLERDPEVVHSFKGDYEWGSCNGSTLFGIPMRHTTYSLRNQGMEYERPSSVCSLGRSRSRFKIRTPSS